MIKLDEHTCLYEHYFISILLMDKTNKLGPYLLSGWTMLEDACPNCLLPLVRNKQKEIICANCGKDYQSKQTDEDNQIQEIEADNKYVEIKEEKKEKKSVVETKIVEGGQHC